METSSTHTSNHNFYPRPVELPGEAFSVWLQDLATEDVALVVGVYRAIQGLRELWLSMSDVPDYQVLREQLATFTQPDFITAVRTIGFATLAMREATPSLRHFFHELRGGKLTSLVLYATLTEKRPNNLSYIHQALLFAQEHAYTMRHLLPDLHSLEWVA